MFYITAKVALRILPRFREATSLRRQSRRQRSGEKTMSVKQASNLAARLSVPAGVTLAATFLVALALTAQVF